MRMNRTADEGPRQVWTWSRIDGSVMRHRVRPSKFEGCWLEEYPYGWSLWPEDYFCDSAEEATRQAREHFRRIANDARAVLAQIG
jgi:hypothetical protein